MKGFHFYGGMVPRIILLRFFEPRSRNWGLSDTSRDGGVLVSDPIYASCFLCLITDLLYVDPWVFWSIDPWTCSCLLWKSCLAWEVIANLCGILVVTWCSCPKGAFVLGKPSACLCWRGGGAKNSLKCDDTLRSSLGMDRKKFYLVSEVGLKICKSQ